jgi:7-keto-8-aminopelargonate synthetase-like enzyme
LAVAAKEALGMLNQESDHPLEGLEGKVAWFRDVLSPLEKEEKIYIPSHEISPMIHVLPNFPEAMLTDKQAQIKVIEEVERLCREGGVLVSRKRRLEQEVEIWEEGIRVCIGNGLTLDEIKRAAEVLRDAITKVMGELRV